MQNRRNYYRVLHVQPDAPREIIHSSYLTLMRRLRMHPDLGGDHWNAAVINEAYQTLSNSVKRAAYDRKLRRQASASPPALPTSTGESSSALHQCVFCDTPHAADAVRSGARCDVCQSPLRPAERFRRDETANRALQRIERRMPMTFTLPWSAHVEVKGTTEDISIIGMQFATGLELLIDEILRIDCAFCTAVGIVRHARAAETPEPTWRIGVEFLTLHIKETRGGIVDTRA